MPPSIDEPTLDAVWARIAADPLLGYALLAGLVLAIAAWGGGLVRGDARALLRPAPWICAALAALAGLTLVVAGERAEAAGLAWPLHGVRRLPLYLVALGYGPTMGLVTAALFAAVEGTRNAVTGAEAILALELLTLGWLAIAPSPRRTRFAAPVGIVLAWTLASATAGLAALAWTHRPLPADAILPALTGEAPGVLVAAAATGLLSPAWWRQATPGAAPGFARAGEVGVPDPPRTLLPLKRRARPRPPRSLHEVRVPPPWGPRAPRRHDLNDPVLPGDMDDTDAAG